MAKRKRMGKHPHNDMKSGTVGNSKIANKGKLDKEYGKTGVKHKYEYLRSHYYDAHGTMDLVFSGDVTNAKTLKLTSTDGTEKTYTAANAENCPSFKRTLDISGSLAACINSSSIGHGSKITATVVASAGSGKIVLTQVESGPDGNTIPVSSAGGIGNTASSSFTGG